ncbi:hypothetical protein SAMN04487948_102239 [Halogranum amylolyticum]|uniref:DUF8027 domain-containing protein n=1 Tax=Halogranum amylolyticum TaxID=660520 RepID=A0A1H8PE78_9EURY|nr:hypothetical protein [Halogranum amylolyticum]SEO39948.1 hypothetical protein SAMN04487948_102239 [Halogranum amylolyticum]
MPISGYDPDDLEQTLAERLAEHGHEEFLTDAEQKRVKAGESLVDVLDGDDIERLLALEDRESTQSTD